MRVDNNYKKFKYRSICHKSGPFNHRHANMFSTKVLIVNEIYDVYLGTYAFSDEYEIYKNGEYYTSFICNKGDISNFEDNVDNAFTKFFYNKSQIRDKKLEELGI